MLRSYMASKIPPGGLRLIGLKLNENAGHVTFFEHWRAVQLKKSRIFLMAPQLGDVHNENASS